MSIWAYLNKNGWLIIQNVYQNISRSLQKNTNIKNNKWKITYMDQNLNNKYELARDHNFPKLKLFAAVQRYAMYPSISSQLSLNFHINTRNILGLFETICKTMCLFYIQFTNIIFENWFKVPLCVISVKMQWSSMDNK